MNRIVRLRNQLITPLGQVQAEAIFVLPTNGYGALRGLRSVRAMHSACARALRADAVLKNHFKDKGYV